MPRLFIISAAFLQHRARQIQTLNLLPDSPGTNLPYPPEERASQQIILTFTPAHGCDVEPLRATIILPGAY